MKYKTYSVLFVIGGLILGWLALNNAMSFAHFHLDWVCESGKELITDETQEQKIERFNANCAQTEEKFKEIFGAALVLTVYSLFLALILVAIGYKVYPVDEDNETNDA